MTRKRMGEEEQLGEDRASRQEMDKQLRCTVVAVRFPPSAKLLRKRSVTQCHRS
jgi:hypothetical protein